MPAPGAYPEKSQATLALVLSILGFCCWPTAVAGLIIANNEKQGISAGRRDPSTAGTAQAAFIIGIVMLVIGIGTNLFWFRMRG
jgi:uncharacterized membrane protein YtjA (UPF0391 family)